MATITDIKNRYKQLEINELDDFIRDIEQDQRKGVAQIALQAKKKRDSYHKEMQRVEKMRLFDEELSHGKVVAGIDEAGRGPLAGPVVASAVILPVDCVIPYIDDSKKLSESKREALFHQIMECAIAIGVGVGSVQEIEKVNILQATFLAMQRAIEDLEIKPEQLHNDAVIIPGISIPQKKIIKGDQKSISIAAASIIAKVTRDRMMKAYNEQYPVYGFSGNKGYGSSEHIQALKEFGPSPIHRQGFLRSILENKDN